MPREAAVQHSQHDDCCKRYTRQSDTAVAQVCSKTEAHSLHMQFSTAAVSATVAVAVIAWHSKAVRPDHGK